MKRYLPGGLPHVATMTSEQFHALDPARRHVRADGQPCVLQMTDHGTALVPVELVDCARCAEDPLADMATMPGELPWHDPACPSL